MDVIYSLLTAMIASCDLYMKGISERRSKTGERKTLKGKVLLRNVHNRGLALNLLEKHPWIVKTASVLGAAVVLCIQFLLYGTRGRFLQKTGVALISGGAISNTVDRLRKGYVVDYIGFDFKKKKRRRITYNLGDFSIFAGIFFFILDLIYN